MKHTQEIEVVRNPKGWHVHALQHWDGWPNPVHTHSGAHSLDWAIYKAASWAADNDTQITSIIVKGKPYSKAQAEACVRKATTGLLAYTQANALAALGELT